MPDIIPDGATVWIKDQAKGSTEAFVKATPTSLPRLGDHRPLLFYSVPFIS